MTAVEWVLFAGVCDVPGCARIARWTQTRTETQVDCPQHPHAPLMGGVARLPTEDRMTDLRTRVLGLLRPHTDALTRTALADEIVASAAICESDELRSLRGVVQALEAPEAIEAAAMALYEDTRDPGYDTPEWDWPNIERSYDKPDEGETDPEWLRNLYRREARVAIRAALAATADAPQPADEPLTLSCVPTGCQCSCHRPGGFHSAHIVACCNPSPAQPADPPTKEAQR